MSDCGGLELEIKSLESRIADTIASEDKAANNLANAIPKLRRNRSGVRLSFQRTWICGVRKWKRYWIIRWSVCRFQFRRCTGQ
jgi:hypothetical protein